jgi:Lipoprotein LpqB beta-propeller domain/Sporulation and spore germination
MTARHQNRLRVLATALLALLLTGCVSLPDGSSVKAARGAGAHRVPSMIRSSPPGPRPDALPQDIVAGYLRAMLAFPSDPALVREFMTPEAAGSWRPEAQTQIYENPEVNPYVKGEVHVNLSLLGSLDVRGSWRSILGPTTPLPMQVVKVAGGQFRIANPVAGTLINTEYFGRYYHQYSLYYFDPTNTFLAPDPVYLQVGAPSATATALIRNLLLGPTDTTKDAVHSAAPAGTRLTPAVAVSSTGVANVPLSGPVASLRSDQLLSLAEQLSWTLRQERVGVNSISISVDGRTRNVQGHGSVFSVASFHDPSDNPSSHTLYALGAKGRLFSVPATSPAVPVTGPISTAVIDARSVAVDPSGDFAALVSGDGTKVVAGGLTPAQSDSPAKTWFRGGSNLLRPSWDGSGLLWLVDGNNRHATLRVATSTQSKVVDAPRLAGTDIRAFALSRDGVRFAAVIGRGKNSQLVVAMIKRDPRSQTEVSLVGLTRIVNSDFPLSDINGLAWVDATNVVVLARDQSSESQPYVVSVDGSRIEPLAGLLPASLVSIAVGAGSETSTILGDDQGALYYQKTQAQWAKVTSTLRLSAPVYPG